MSAKFGPAGVSESFPAMGYRSSMDIANTVSAFGLDWFEYQCGRGVNIKEDKAAAMGAACAKAGIGLSIHAPYYISLASADPAKRENSISYILQTARAADAMGATRIVIHPGGKGKFTRQEAMALATDTFSKAIRAVDEAGLGHITLCPETMGKINQIGSLDEVLALCQLDECVIPCLDFGHLNARTYGAIRTIEDYRVLFDTIENAIGRDRLRRYHAHFSKIEWSQGGEVRHLTFEDQVYGPAFEPLLELTAQKGGHPVIICESAGTQAEDAKTMKTYYQSLPKEEDGE